MSYKSSFLFSIFVYAYKVGDLRESGCSAEKNFQQNSRYRHLLDALDSGHPQLSLH